MTCFDGCCTFSCRKEEMEWARSSRAPLKQPKPASTPVEDLYSPSPKLQPFHRLLMETSFNSEFRPCQGPAIFGELCFERTIPAQYVDVRGVDCMSAKLCYTEYTAMLSKPAHVQRVTFNFMTGAVQVCSGSVCFAPSEVLSLRSENDPRQTSLKASSGGHYRSTERVGRFF